MNAAGAVKTCGERTSLPRITHNRPGFVLLTGIALALSHGGVLAADPTPGVGAGSLLKALLALALVLIAVFAIAWVARRVSPLPAGGTTLRLQGGVSVGARERVMVLEVKDTWLVLGVAPGQVNLLHTLPRPEAEAAPITAQNDKRSFAAWLGSAMRRRSDA